MTSRLRALRRFARARRFDVALSTHPTSCRLRRGLSGCPRRTHSTTSSRGRSTASAAGRRPGRRPRCDPPERLDRIGARARKVRRYPGLKEEYYLHGFEPDPGVLYRLGGPARILAVVRTPPDVSLYHRHENPLFAGVLERLGGTSRSTRSSCRGRASSATAIRVARAAVAARSRAGGRRPEPRRARRSHRLGRRDDEPRGGGARHARLHDLHGPARRRRRGADPRRAAVRADRPRRRSSRRSARTAATPTDATRGCCSTCFCRPEGRPTRAGSSADELRPLISRPRRRVRPASGR